MERDLYLETRAEPACTYDAAELTRSRWQGRSRAKTSEWANRTSRRHESTFRGEGRPCSRFRAASEHSGTKVWRVRDCSPGFRDVSSDFLAGHARRGKSSSVARPAIGIVAKNPDLCALFCAWAAVSTSVTGPARADEQVMPVQSSRTRPRRTCAFVCPRECAFVCRRKRAFDALKSSYTKVERLTAIAHGLFVGHTSAEPRRPPRTLRTRT